MEIKSPLTALNTDRCPFCAAPMRRLFHMDQWCPREGMHRTPIHSPYAHAYGYTAVKKSTGAQTGDIIVDGSWVKNKDSIKWAFVSGMEMWSVDVLNSGMEQSEQVKIRLVMCYGPI